MTDLGDHVDLGKMVARAQCADLIDAAFLGLVAHLGGIGADHPAAFFGVGDIFLAGKALFQCPAAAVDQDVIQFGLVEMQVALHTHAARHVAVKRIGQTIDMWSQFRGVQMGREQANAAVDIIADAAGRDHPARQPGGHHATDREAVALVNIGHRQRLADHAGQGRRVDQLFQGAIFQGLFKNVVVCVEMSRHAHVVPEFLRHFVDILVDFLQVIARD